MFLIPLDVRTVMSASAHLYRVVGKEVSALLWKLDHNGIVVGASTAFFPICFFAFACEPWTAVAYVSATCFLAAAVATVSMSEIFHRPSFRCVSLNRSHLQNKTDLSLVPL